MEDVRNRQASPKKRGRPPKATVEARPEPAPLAEVPIRIPGCVCPSCGRAMVPKVLRGTDLVKYCVCTLCSRQFKAERKAVGATWYAQVL